MPKRPARWQAQKAATAKALRETLMCEKCGFNSGKGWGRDGLWLCIGCAADARKAERTAAPRET